MTPHLPAIRGLFDLRCQGFAVKYYDFTLGRLEHRASSTLLNEVLSALSLKCLKCLRKKWGYWLFVIGYWLFVMGEREKVKNYGLLDETEN